MNKGSDFIQFIEDVVGPDAAENMVKSYSQDYMIADARKSFEVEVQINADVRVAQALLRRCMGEGGKVINQEAILNKFRHFLIDLKDNQYSDPNLVLLVDALLKMDDFSLIAYGITFMEHLYN